MNSVFLSVEPGKTVLLIGKKGNNQLKVFLDSVTNLSSIIQKMISIFIMYPIFVQVGNTVLVRQLSSVFGAFQRVIIHSPKFALIKTRFCFTYFSSI